jgi:hypothetical protein
MVKKGVTTLVLAGLILLAVSPMVEAFCEESQDYWCGIQCTWVWGGIYCYHPSNPNRACWDSGTGHACGEDADYEGCSCNNGLTGGF